MTLVLAIPMYFAAGAMAQRPYQFKDLHDFGGTVINANGISAPDGTFPYARVTFDRAGRM